MKKQLDEAEFYNAWLKPIYGITVEELIKKEPELCKTSEWYKKYAVTQEQHDRWYEWAVGRIAKHYGFGKKVARQRFAFHYLNVSPSIKKDEVRES